VGYGRVSSADQDLRLQVDALLAYGVHPDNIHTDKLSGVGDKRPGLVAAMKDCREGDMLVVWKLDRISRRLVPMLQTLERLEQRGIGLKVLTEPIDTTTAVGRLMLHILASFAQFERDLGVERTRAGLLAAKARGRVGGSQPKYRPEKYAEAERLMTHEGLSPRAAAKAVRISPSTLYRHLGRKADAEGASDIG
jgi:DNA invertase Pin-like site-specific DNA recombinase